MTGCHLVSCLVPGTARYRRAVARPGEPLGLGPALPVPPARAPRRTGRQNTVSRARRSRSEFHDAHRMGGLAVVADHAFADAQIPAAQDPADGGLDEVCGLVDAKPDLGEGLFAACAEEDVLAEYVDVPEDALQRIGT